LYLGGAVASNSIRTPEATMPEPARRGAILASPSVSQPGELDRLNAILEEAGLGRPLGRPELSMSEVVMLPVSEDPQKVVAALRRGAPEGGDHHCEAPANYGIHTIKHRTRRDGLVAAEGFTPKFSAKGLKSGHGTVSWEVVRKRAMPRKPPWRPPDSPPVVVVLDSGVKQHPWLPKTKHPKFCVDAGELGFSPAVPVPDHALDNGNFGAYWGHATFLAGLIRVHARDATVLSVKLMNDAGKIDDHNVVPALNWLLEHIENGGVADVVLMAFGRARKPDEPNPHILTQLIAKLRHKKGVEFVASAGNDHSHDKTIPACLDNVVSVGAGISANDREWYSNYGPWVREWRPGTAVSLMPLTGLEDRDNNEGDGNGFALWSGTSFSAAVLAGELAQARARERAAGGGS